jgi:hypothetical protein
LPVLAWRHLPGLLPVLLRPLLEPRQQLALHQLLPELLRLRLLELLHPERLGLLLALP